jgi:hypothetical protein
VLPWREISTEMRLLRVAAVVAFIGTAAAALANAYIEDAALSQPTTATATYGYPIRVKDQIRYLTPMQDEIHRLATPVMTWGVSAVILLGGLHVLLDSRQREAARCKRIRDLLEDPPKK